MIRQRPAGRAAVVQALAEQLPFPSASFDVALAVLTVHHWSDRRGGLTELARVARRVVIVTRDPACRDLFWRTSEYLPEIIELDLTICPTRAELAHALRRARYLYLTTYSDAGKPGTVPTWCWLHDDAVYFTTQRASLKARRIAKNGRVTVHVGRKDGPAFEGRAELVEDRRDLEKAILAAYHRKYWIPVPRSMGRYLRKGLEARTSVLVRVRPTTP